MNMFTSKLLLSESSSFTGITEEEDGRKRNNHNIITIFRHFSSLLLCISFKFDKRSKTLSRKTLLDYVSSYSLREDGRNVERYWKRHQWKSKQHQFNMFHDGASHHRRDCEMFIFKHSKLNIDFISTCLSLFTPVSIRQWIFQFSSVENKTTQQ